MRKYLKGIFLAGIASSFIAWPVFFVPTKAAELQPYIAVDENVDLNRNVDRVDDRKFEYGKMYDYKHSSKKVLLANPLVVLYPSGPHGIVGESGVLHEGIDFVIRDFYDKGKFYQWFWGTSSTEGLHGEYSIWKPAVVKSNTWYWWKKDQDKRKDAKCPKNWILVPDAAENWGDYLKSNTDYCVYTQNF